MKSGNHYLQLKFFSVPVLVLYSLFFTVQVFFNFDTGVPSDGAASRHAIFAEKKEPRRQFVSGRSNSEKRQHSKVRLNKRFQPANSPVLNHYYVTAPVIFIEKPIVSGYPDPFHASPSLFTRPLRGPPAVVYHFV